MNSNYMVWLILATTFIGCAPSATVGSKKPGEGQTAIEAKAPNSAVRKEIAPAYTLDHPIGPIAFSPDGERLATGAVRIYGPGFDASAPFQGKLTVWDFKQGTISDLPVPANWETTSLSFNKQGDRLVSVKIQPEPGSARYFVHVYILDIANKTPVLDEQIKRVFYYQPMVSPDGSTLMGGLKDGTVEFWDAETRTVRNHTPSTGVARDGQVSLPVMSADWSVLGIYNQADATVDFYSYPELTLLGSVPKKSIDLYWVIATDRRTVYVSNRNTQLIDVWDYTTPQLKGTLLRTISQAKGLALSLSLDGTVLALNSAGIDLFRMPEGNHIGKVNCNLAEQSMIRFSPDAKFMAFGGQQGGQSRVEVWDLSQFGRPVE